MQDEIEVSNDDFETAMKGWFRNKKVPLLSSELGTKGTFANPATGQVEVARVEDYIMLSELPCGAMGRFVYVHVPRQLYCGQVQMPALLPQMIRTITRAPTLLPFVATAITQQGRTESVRYNWKSKLPRTMLSLMRAIRESDMSMPAEVRGVDFDDIVCSRIRMISRCDGISWH